MRTRTFADGIIDATLDALRAYRAEFVRPPHTVTLHPDDADPGCPRLFNLTVIRDPSVERGHVRVCGVVSDGVGSVDR